MPVTQMLTDGSCPGASVRGFQVDGQRPWLLLFSYFTSSVLTPVQQVAILYTQIQLAMASVLHSRADRWEPEPESPQG
jgi:hypothetical protein